MAARRGLCRIGLHNWVVVRKPGVAPYWGCKRCEKEKLIDTRPEAFGGATEGKLFGYRDR
jgi:hypothetical protein